MQRPASWTRRRSNAARRLAAIAVIGAAGTVAVTVGTAAASAKGHQASKPVTLQFWSTYNKADKEDSTFVNVVIKRFEKLNPGIKVNSVVYPYADLLPKFLATSAAGDPPDLMRSDIAWVPQLAAQGVVAERRQPAGLRGDQGKHPARPARDHPCRHRGGARLLRVPGRHQHPGAVLEQD